MNAALRMLRVLRRWHGRLGALAAVFLLLLALSGILLNHPEAAGLAQRNIHSGALAGWYGFKTQAAPWIYRSGPHRLAWGNGMWLLGEKVIAEDAGDPAGMVQMSEVLYIATADSLFSYGPGGRLIEKISAEALPGAPIEALGTKDDRLHLRTATGIFSSTDTLDWEPAAADAVRWSRAQRVTPAEQEALAARLVPRIPLQRLIADVHSGRIFGRYGTLAVDGLGVLLILLALSGAWLFLRPRRATRG